MERCLRASHAKLIPINLCGSLTSVDNVTTATWLYNALSRFTGALKQMQMKDVAWQYFELYIEIIMNGLC